MDPESAETRGKVEGCLPQEGHEFIRHRLLVVLVLVGVLQLRSVKWRVCLLMSGDAYLLLQVMLQYRNASLSEVIPARQR